MKPFDLERAKAGDPVIARNLMLVKFLAHYPDASENCRVVFMTPKDSGLPWLQRSQIWTCNERGQQEVGENEWDLFMAPCKREGWMNVYPDYGTDNTPVLARGDTIYTTIENARTSKGAHAIDTVKIEWEEG